MSAAADGELQRKIEEYRSRERVYLATLAGQEGDLSKLRGMNADVLRAYGDRSRAALSGALVFPTANMEVLHLREKVRDRDQQVTHLKEELEANRFDQHLPAGQALMRKCKALLTENRELGEEMRDERLGELRAALEAERRRNGQLDTKVNEAADFCKELSDENVKLQGTIARVAGKLREARSELEVLVKERAEAKKRRKIEKGAKAALAAMKADASVGGEAAEQPVLAADGVEVDEDEAPAEPELVLAPAPVVADVVPPAHAGEKKEKKKDKEKKSKKRKAEKADLANG